MNAVNCRNTTNFMVNTNYPRKKYAVPSTAIVAMVCMGTVFCSHSSVEHQDLYFENFEMNSYIQYNVSENKTGHGKCMIDLLKAQNINKIDLMAKFEDDWNGNGAKRFSINAINTFKEVINNLVKQPEIAPTGRDSLFLQYTLDDGSELGFELSATKLEKVYVPKGDFDLLQNEVVTEDFYEYINTSVRDFYGLD